MTAPTTTSDGSLSVRGLSKSYQNGELAKVDVLTAIDLELAAGGQLAIVGPSGSGKSTLLHILGTLDRPTAGEVSIGGEQPFALDDDRLAEFRHRRIGFVFQ